MKSEINCFTHNLNGNDVKKGKANKKPFQWKTETFIHATMKTHFRRHNGATTEREKRHDLGADTKTTSIEQRHNRVYIDIKPC